MKRTKHFPLDTEKVLSAYTTQAAWRFLVANYYQAQETRKRLDMQLRHLGDRVQSMNEDDIKTMNHLADVYSEAEKEIARVFPKMLTTPVDAWLLAQRGVGPITAMGLRAHIDIERAPTAGAIWKFAGLVPKELNEYGKGKKRPYNAQLKQICWHIGQGFMKQHNDPDCFYGKIYRQRKLYEIAQNEAGAYSEKAKAFKLKKARGDDGEEQDKASKGVLAKLAAGKLPDFNIDDRARRYAVKIFLSHLHTVMYWDKFKKLPPKPFALGILNHAHEIRVPNVDMFPGLEDALYGSRCLVAA
jgi:hypothetical protein